MGKMIMDEQWNNWKIKCDTRVSNLDDLRDNTHSNTLAAEYTNVSELQYVIGWMINLPMPGLPHLLVGIITSTM